MPIPNWLVANANTTKQSNVNNTQLATQLTSRILQQTVSHTHTWHENVVTNNLRQFHVYLLILTHIQASIRTLLMIVHKVMGNGDSSSGHTILE